MISLSTIKHGPLQDYWTLEERDDKTGKLIRNICTAKTRANLMMIVRSDFPDLIQEAQKLVQKSVGNPDV